MYSKQEKQKNETNSIKQQLDDYFMKSQKINQKNQPPQLSEISEFDSRLDQYDDSYFEQKKRKIQNQQMKYSSEIKMEIDSFLDSLESVSLFSINETKQIEENFPPAKYMSGGLVSKTINDKLKMKQQFLPYVQHSARRALNQVLDYQQEQQIKKELITNKKDLEQVSALIQKAQINIFPNQMKDPILIESFSEIKEQDSDSGIFQSDSISNDYQGILQIIDNKCKKHDRL
ncbi:UNKNOWN [Stylonychia lemnae]|uniref:Uncharacterized protein n=1 Tax=Stylonychia lemnae TaxID=5949 RepID=A0A078AJ49_STYLE|nr:UNKNOWN [Stylonychia lemnae]|eukprot:CDW81921.1 UNKNOWN [Stylonychia lemnae]